MKKTLQSTNNKKGAGLFNNVYRGIINRFSKEDSDIINDINKYYLKDKKNLYNLSLTQRKNLRGKIINRIIFLIQNINYFKKKNITKSIDLYKNRLFNIIDLINNKIYLYINKNFHEHINFSEGKNTNIIQNSEDFNEIMLNFVLIKLKNKYQENDIKDVFFSIYNKSNINDIIKIINNNLNNKPNIASNNDFDSYLSSNSLHESFFKTSSQSRQSQTTTQHNTFGPPLSIPIRSSLSQGTPLVQSPFQGPVSGSVNLNASKAQPFIEPLPTPSQSLSTSINIQPPPQPSISNSLKNIIDDDSITILSDPKKKDKIKLEILRNNEKPYGNQEYINILEYFKTTKYIHTISLHSITNDSKYYYLTFANKPDGNLKKFMQEINNVAFHFNALHQLLLACMLFHKLTGKLHTNLNSENIYYYKIENNLNTENYFGYYFNALNKTFYIRNMGYLWVLSDFNETQILPQDETILFNNEYKKLNADYEPYHMYFEYRAILEIYKEYLNTIVDPKFELLRSYIDVILFNTKNINEKYKKLLLDQKLTSQQKLTILDRQIFTKYMQNDFLLLRHIKNKTKQSKVYLQEIIE